MESSDVGSSLSSMNSCRRAWPRSLNWRMSLFALSGMSADEVMFFSGVFLENGFPSQCSSTVSKSRPYLT